MISYEHRCIFVHIPRSGGTSLEDAIWPGPRDASQLWMGFVTPGYNKYQTGGLQHLLASQIRLEVGAEIFASYFKFSIVRNPWSKAVSQYSVMKRRPDLRDFLGLKEEDPFKRYLELIRNKTHVQWEKQYRFIMDEDGRCLVDFVGRFEEYASAASLVLGRLGLQAELGHAEATEHGPYSEYYDSESADMVRDLYRDDIRIFDYSFS